MKINKENFEFEVIDNEFWKDTSWETFTYECVKKFSNPDKIFIDIGSWIGPISLVASKLNKFCYSFEPDVVAFNELQKNISSNDIKNIIVNNIAITNKTRIITLGNDNSMGNSNTRINSTKNIFEVTGKSLNEFIEENKINKNDISMIKLDVEGSELEIIQDKFFEDCCIPLHLSIHVPFYLNGMNDLGSVIKFIDKYSYIVSDYEKNWGGKSHTLINGFFSLMLYN